MYTENCCTVLAGIHIEILNYVFVVDGNFCNGTYYTYVNNFGFATVFYDAM
ncbi:MAG: hypothetical protein Q4G68_06845 [Planctomycetia bacterium]|nr:hypothetical protein [Planctomycetia bacterium]